MRYFILDGAAVESREMLHEILKAGLDFPDWYGGNLDALCDCLCDLDDTTLEIVNAAALETVLGHYTVGFIAVLRDAMAENPKLHVIC